MKQLVLDLETKKSFAQVGGAQHKHKLGVSVVGVYDYETDEFRAYREEHFGGLTSLLKSADKIIGFNLIGFDWPVLAAELGDWVLELPTLDLMVEARKALGHRVSLDSLSQATLGGGKIGSGMDALYYYDTGDWEKLERYCLEDVKLTRDLYEYAKKNGALYFMKGKRRAPVAMSFSESPYTKVFREAAKAKASVKMRYGAKDRLVDIIRFDGAYIRGYCHLRNEELTFRLDRVEDAERVASSTPLF